MSDFLQLKDEILNGDPKFNITDNADGTKNIELATEVIQQATDLNNYNLGKHLNPILGYNETSVEQEDIESIISLTNLKTSYGNVDTSATDFQQIGRVFIEEGKYANLQMKLGVNPGSFALNSKSSNLNNYNMYNFLGVNNAVKEDYKGYGLQSGGSTKQVSATFRLEQGVFLIKSFSYANGTTSNSAYINFYDSDGNSVYSKNSIIGGKTTATYENLDDYIEVQNIVIGGVGYADNRSNPSFTLGFNDVKLKLNSKQNILTLNNITSTFVDRQILNIYTPIIDNTGVLNCTLNGINIDSLLESNKYYELMYDETNNRFIAEEVRNAN